MVILILSLLPFIYLLVNCKSSAKNEQQQDPVLKKCGSSVYNKKILGNPNDREDNDSVRTKIKTNIDEDDIFKDLNAKLDQNAIKKEGGTESLLAEDELNPLADFKLPDRPKIEPHPNSEKNHPHIVQMEKKAAAAAAPRRKPRDNRSGKSLSVDHTKTEKNQRTEETQSEKDGKLPVNKTQNSEEKIETPV